MFRKINTSPNLLRWVCATVLGTAVYFLWFRSYAESDLPWNAAFFLTINEAIRMYAGDSFNGGDLDLRYRMLAILVVGYAVIPTLFLYSWRRIFREQMAATVGHSVMFILTGAITFVLFVPSFWEAIERHDVAKKTEVSFAMQNEKEELMQDIGRLAYDAYVYRLLPSSAGGGNNSFVGYRPPAGAASSSGSQYEVTHIDNSVIRFRGMSAVYLGSAVSAEIDSTGQIKNFAYEGLFTM
jgi:hypothetical protein